MFRTINSCPRGSITAMANLFSKAPSVTVKPTEMKISKLKIDAAFKAKLEVVCESLQGNRDELAAKHRAKMKELAQSARMEADEVKAIMKGIQDTACLLQKVVKNGAPPPPPPLPTEAQLTACRISSSWNLAGENKEEEKIVLSRTKQDIIKSIQNKAAQSNHQNPVLPDNFLEQLKKRLHARNISAE